MMKLSTGEDSTLGVWLRLCITIFGEDSSPTRYMSEKIERSPLGHEEPVYADEQQLMHALTMMYLQELRK